VVQKIAIHLTLLFTRIIVQARNSVMNVSIVTCFW